jgi:nitrogen regulation protein NR(I)
MAVVLVVDDDPLILQVFDFLFPSGRHTLVKAASGREALAAFEQAKPDVAISDVRLPDIDGLELVRRFQTTGKKTPIILMTGFGTAEIAIEAMRLGAYDYLLKPVDPDLLVPMIERAIAVSRQMRSPLKMDDGATPLPSTETLIGRSPSMQEVFKSIGRVAPLDVPVLILGESGTGKEMVARAIYQYSRRCAEKFLAVNCAAIPETLLESELFGHEKGAFTGADRKRPGKFEQCDGGTLFLDEIGDMTPLMQTKMLRVLQEQTFERVGGSQTIRTDVRVIAATNRNLEAAIAEGTFRADLYYRLDVCTIQLPPLRERKADVPTLAESFLRRFREEVKKDVQGISEDAMSLLVEYRWPGNVRELQSAVKQAIVQASGPIVQPENLPAAIRGERPLTPILNEASGAPALDRLIQERIAAGTSDLYEEVVQWVERRLLSDAMKHSRGNVSQAARLLGISRPTLRAKLNALSLDDNGTEDPA